MRLRLFRCTPASRWLPWLLPIQAVLVVGCRAGPEVASGPPGVDSVSVHRFGMYSFGASGVAQLSDGRIIIAEDERLHPLVIVDLFGTGAAREFLPPEVERVFGAAGVLSLNDLEGITRDSLGHFYATTSHAVPRSGTQTSNREEVVRFEVVGDSLVHPAVLRRLAEAIGALDGTLSGSLGRVTKTRGPSPGLNIEGIAWDFVHGNLLFGLRGPLEGGRALVVRLTNPNEVFGGAAPVLSGPYPLDLEGQGIRDLTYDELSGGFLIVAGASGMSAWGHAALWWWSGDPGQQPMRLRVPILAGLKPEGVALVTVGARKVVLFVCDDGTLDSRFYKGKAGVNEGIPSRYAVLPYGLLTRDNPALPRAVPADAQRP